MGKVESVLYSRNKQWPCYVAVTDTDHHSESNKFHASRNMMMCTFAEKSYEKELNVSMRAEKPDYRFATIKTLTWPHKQASYFREPDVSDLGTFHD